MPFDQLRDFDRLPNSAVARLHVAWAILGVSATTGWRLIQAGELEKVTITARTAGILVGSIRRYQSKRKAAEKLPRPLHPTSVDFDDDLIEPAEVGREYG